LPFGKIGLNFTRGAIEVSARIDQVVMDTSRPPIKVSLDGGADVDIPHVFENVPAGGHVIRIPEVLVGSKFYLGLEENVTVEPGKRLIFNPMLSRGKVNILVDDIPAGFKFLIDGEELTLKENPSGGMVFAGTVDAGTPRLDVIYGNKDWYSIPYVPIDTTITRKYSVKDMSLQVTLQRKTISMKNKAEDWAGIDPSFGGSATLASNIPGSIISSCSVCRDDMYIYFKMGFSNGNPEFLVLDRSSDRKLSLDENKPPYGNVSLQLNGGKNGIGRSTIWIQSNKSWTQAGSYSIGPSFIALSFPLSSISKYFDFFKPIRARLETQLNDQYTPLSSSTTTDIIVESPGNRE
jgi:hypothetical protein